MLLNSSLSLSILDLNMTSFKERNKEKTRNLFIAKEEIDRLSCLGLFSVFFFKVKIMASKKSEKGGMKDQKKGNNLCDINHAFPRCVFEEPQKETCILRNRRRLRGKILLNYLSQSNIISDTHFKNLYLAMIGRCAFCLASSMLFIFCRNSNHHHHNHSLQCPTIMHKIPWEHVRCVKINQPQNSFSLYA